MTRPPDVWLVGVGRNLNRCIRTLASFGGGQIMLLDCADSYLKGNLYSAKSVSCAHVKGRPPSNGTLVLEVGAKTVLKDVDWSRVSQIVIGGESITIPAAFPSEQRAMIRTLAPCLTVEAALAIALYAWSTAS